MIDATQSEIWRRIHVSVLAYAYEIDDAPLATDDAYDHWARSIRPEISTGRPDLDDFFRTEFTPHTGQWVRRHPEIRKLRVLTECIRTGNFSNRHKK